MSSDSNFPMAGIVGNLPWDQYVSIRRMNPSTLVEGKKSMRHLCAAINGGFREETSPMRLGTGIHALALEPDEFAERFVVMPDFHLDEENVTGNGKRSDSKATKYYKDKAVEFCVAAANKTILPASEYRKALAATEAVHAHHSAGPIVRSHAKEQTVFGVIEGVPFRGRIDLLGEFLVDLKTTASCNDRAFGRVCGNLHYPFKMAIYRELVRQSTGKTLEVKAIAQEVSGVFDTAVYDFDSITIDNAFTDVLTVIRQYKKCLEADVWPGFDKGCSSLPIYIHNWAMDDEEPFDFEDGDED